ncbi:hypothetical protein [Devosia sp. MC1541]|uniref:hypothetical protein n=1 Tax=Devosia sp. MC1541 TaxID=2725264 RepID=UPI00145E56C9|nr:hypothetical protein [Devosia sp. MC1541]
MKATRERKESFILSFGKPVVSGNDAVSDLLRTHGLSLFDDAAIDEMVGQLIDCARRAIKRNIQNRRAYQREAAA